MKIIIVNPLLLEKHLFHCIVKASNIFLELRGQQLNGHNYLRRSDGIVLNHCLKFWLESTSDSVNKPAINAMDIILLEKFDDFKNPKFACVHEEIFLITILELMLRL